MQLGDSFPLEQYIDNSLLPGQIIILWCDFTQPPKNKFLVFIVKENIPILFLINSQPSNFVRNRKELFKSQVKISSEDYNFLDHDSYIDCSRIINHFTLSAIVMQLKSNPDRLKEQITHETTERIIQVISESKLHNQFMKNKIIKSLSGNI